MNFKKLLSIILVCCMLMAVLSLTACGGNDDDKTNENGGTNNNNQNGNADSNSYTITVVDNNNNPVVGVVIGVMATGYQSHITNQNGKVSFTPDKADFKVQIVTVPKAYDKPADLSLNFASGSKELTVRLNKTTVADTKVTYTVTVLDQDGNPVSGVTVQLCTDALCYDTTTDLDGIGTKDLEPGVEYKVAIPKAPEGYTAPSGYFDTIGADETEITINITKN